MAFLPRTATARKPVPTPAGGRTTDAILGRIYTALNDDGSYVVPGSIDTQGMTVVAGCYRFRLELSEAELMDWEEHSPPACTNGRLGDRLDAFVGVELEVDRDWMADTGGDIAF